MIGMTNTGGGRAGAKLAVTAPAGVTVTASKGTRTYTRIANDTGKATFTGLETGTWALSISDATHEPTTPVNVKISADYNVTLAFFSATIIITYPAGSTCKATHTDGTTLTAPDTSGTWSCIVPSAGTWTVTASDGTNTKSQSVEITSEGQAISLVISYDLELYNNGSYIVPFTAYAGTCGSVSSGTPTISNQSSHFVMTMPSSTAGSYVSNSAVNITDYNTLILEYEHQASDTNSSWDCVICLMNKPTDNWYSNYVMRKAIPLTSNKSVLTADVSGINGNYYVHLGIYGNRTLKVYDLRFKE